MNVYLIQHKSEPRFKIGKANDIESRASALDKENNIDRTNVVSIDTNGDIERAFEIERALHSILSPWRLEPRVEWGSGKTEWFDLKAWQTAFGIIQNLKILARITGYESNNTTPTSKRAATQQPHASLEIQFTEFLANAGYKTTSKSIAKKRDDGEELPIGEHEEYRIAYCFLQENFPGKTTKTIAKKIINYAILMLPPTASDYSSHGNFDCLNYLLSKKIEIEKGSGKLETISSAMQQAISARNSRLLTNHHRALHEYGLSVETKGGDPFLSLFIANNHKKARSLLNGTTWEHDNNPYAELAGVISKVVNIDGKSYRGILIQTAIPRPATPTNRPSGNS